MALLLVEVEKTKTMRKREVMPRRRWGIWPKSSEALIKDLLANDVPKAWFTVKHAWDKSSSKKNGGGDKQTPAHVALFSLGNLCAHEECRSALIKLGVQEILCSNHAVRMNCSESML